MNILPPWRPKPKGQRKDLGWCQRLWIDYFGISDREATWLCRLCTARTQRCYVCQGLQECHHLHNQSSLFSVFSKWLQTLWLPSHPRSQEESMTKAMSYPLPIGSLLFYSFCSTPPPSHSHSFLLRWNSGEGGMPRKHELSSQRHHALQECPRFVLHTQK